LKGVNDIISIYGFKANLKKKSTLPYNPIDGEVASESVLYPIILLPIKKVISDYDKISTKSANSFYYYSGDKPSLGDFIVINDISFNIQTIEDIFFKDTIVCYMVGVK